MKILDLLILCRNVLLDFRVIFITIAVILIISLANYVVKYKKKPPRVRKQKIVPPPEKEKSSDEEKEEE